MYSHLLRKTYNLNLKLKSREIKVVYKQATLQELFEFLTESSNDNFNIIEFIFHFIEEKGKIKLDVQEKEEISLKYKEIFENLQKTLFKSFFNEQKGGGGSKAPFSSFILLICDKFSCDPNYLMENYTWEQISGDDGYLDGIVWNINEQTKEGQQKNRNKHRFKQSFTNSRDDDLEIAKQLENRLKNK